MSERVWRPPWPVDVGRVLFPLRRGPGDPAFQVVGDEFWRASFTPAGPGTLALVMRGQQVHGRAWGPGADWLLDGMPALLGADDTPEALVPVDDVVRAAVAGRGGLRLGRTQRVWEAFVPAVLEQKVLGIEAQRAWRYLLRAFGEPAPGNPELRVPPPREVWRQIPSWEWHRAGAEAVRAHTIINAARIDLEDAPAKLPLLPGVGVWTTAEVRQRAFGDPDALSVGDYHLAGLVGWAMVGRKVDDAGMLELLEPYAGQRHRVTRLLGGPRPPRRGPRLPVRDYRSF
ncbi:MAG: DNA-3-methyladenine glycosylase 2 family protein [Streptosporangiaceae bacterium]